MKKLIAAILILTLLITPKLKADEGMWLLPLIKELNIETMQSMGLELTAEQIYSINESSLKDAIVIFGGGCTGSLISNKGLVLTNHHCGYEQIQQLSSLDHNYLENGFWASSFKDELPAPGLKVTFIKEIKEVTEKVLAEVKPDMSFDARNTTIDNAIKAIVAEQGGDSFEKALVKPFFAGNRYYLIITQEFRDVRFVGAPPVSIGKFGHDTDNWVWPRHTGDFSLFRVYSDVNGNPADYSPDNIPYQPIHHLPVSLKGYQPGDFNMIMGFPGSTDRYLPSWGIEERMEIYNNALITVRGDKLEILAEAMAADPKIKLQYASKYARSSNYWKNSIGMNKGLKDLKVIDKKRALEAEFAEWVAASEERTAKYGKLLKELEEAYTTRKDVYKAAITFRETMRSGTEILSFAYNAERLEKALKDNKEKTIKSVTDALRENAEDFFKNYDAATDQKVFAAMMRRYKADIDPKYYPSFFKDVEKKYKGDFDLFAAKLFKSSLFVNKDTYLDFLEKPTLKALQADPIYTVALSAMQQNEEILKLNNNSADRVENANRLFMAGLMEMNPEKSLYPDANFTLRLTYGKVGDYEPRDGVIYKYYTTLKGVMEKEDPNNFEFIVPEKLKELYNNADFGRYAAADGKLYVNYINDLDITGGNSGSPVINGKGELVGLAFDGNWEAMSGDIAFEPELQRCINVDIRYVLFIIDKFAGATNLIEELSIVE